MAQLGGFFAVVYVSERAIHDGLDAAWRVGWDKVRQPVAWAAPTPRGQVVALGVLAPDRPSVSFDSALNGVRVALSAGARVSISVGAEKPRDAFVELRTNLAAPIRLTQEQVSTPAWVDLSSLTIEPVNVGVTWVDGTRDPLVEAALNSPEVRREMAAQLREALAPLLTVRLPMDKAWLAQLALTYQGVPGSALYLPMVQLGGVRILDGWLAVGIDATADTAQTKGDVNGIGAPPDAPPPAAKPPLVLEDLGDQSLRVLLDPVPLKKYLEKNAEFALRMAAAQRPGIRPRPEFSIDFDNDAVVLHASGTVNAPNPFPGAAFFAAAIRLTPFIPKNTQTVYAHIKPNITVDAPWYLEVLGAIIDFFGGDAFAKLKRANKSELAILFPLVYSHSAPEFVAGVRGTRIVMRPDHVGIYGEARTGSNASGPEEDLRARIYPYTGIRRRLLDFGLMPYRLSRDPNYLVRYRIRAGSSGEEIASGQAWSGSSERFGGEVDMWDARNVLETSYLVDLETHRPPGTIVAAYTERVDVRDLFDRAHPYARWRKKHYFSGEGPVEQPMIRMSAVHRTGVRERCLFSDAGTLRDVKQYTIQALDTVPPPDEEGFSTHLCPYCFPDA